MTRLETSTISDGVYVDVGLLVDAELAIPVPGLSQLTVGLATDPSGRATANLGYFGGAQACFQIYPTDFVLCWDTPQLRTVATPARPAGPLTVQVRGELSFGFDLQLVAHLESFSLPRFTIVGTGLEIELARCQLDLSRDSALAPVLALGFQADFQGFYAAQASLVWLPELLTLGGAPGLRLRFTDVAIGSTGLAFDLTQTFALNERRLLSSEVAGALLDPRWAVAIGSVSGRVRSSAPVGFGLTGRLQLPLLPGPVDFALSLRSTGGITSTIFSVSQGAGAISLASGQVRITGLGAAGTIAEDSCALSGHVTLVEIPALGVTLSKATASFSHSRTRDEVKITLGVIPLGALGKLSGASLIVVDEGGVQTVVVEGTLSGRSLAAAGVSFPRLARTPGVDATVTARVSFSESTAAEGLRIEILATLDDIESLWTGIPRRWQPVDPKLSVQLFARFPTGSSLAAASKPTLEITGSLSFVAPTAWQTDGPLKVRTGGGRITASVSVSETGAKLTLENTAGIALELPDGAKLELQSLSAAFAADAIDVSGAVALAAGPDRTQALGLGKARPLMEPLVSALDARATLAIHATKLDTDEENGSLTLTFDTANGEAFSLMSALGRVLRPGAPAGKPMYNGVPVDGLLDIEPGALVLAVELGRSPSVSVQTTLSCTLLQERFDVGLAVRVDEQKASLAVEMGMTDPVLLQLPAPSLTITNREFNRIARAWYPNDDDPADLAGRQALQGARQSLEALFGSGEDLSPGILEYSEIGIQVDTDANVEVHGTVQMIKAPGFLSSIFPVRGPRLTVGASPERIYVALETQSEAPLVRLPAGVDEAGQARSIALFLCSFELSYAFASNTVGLGMSAQLVATPPTLLNLNVLGNGVLAATPLQASLRMGVPLTPAPIPIPEWHVSYGVPREHGDSPLAGLGGQVFFGLTDELPLVRYYLRESTFSLSYLPLSPGFVLDAGWILGGPKLGGAPPHSFATADQLLSAMDMGPYRKERSGVDTADNQAIVRANKLKTVPYAHVDCRKLSVLLLAPPVALAMNPLAILTPGIPLLIPIPPGAFVDVYVDRLSAAFHIPGLVHASFSFERPIPQYTFALMLESFAFASSGFTRRLPASSALSTFYFTRVSGSLSLLGGTPTTFTSTASIVDLINGLFSLAEGVQTAMAAGQDLMADLQKDPDRLVRLLPAEARLVQGSFAFMGFTFSGSLALLTRQELLEELVLYHESRRPRKTGPAATLPPAPAFDVSHLVGRVLGAESLVSTVGAQIEEILDPDGDEFSGRAFSRDAAVEAAALEPVAREISALWDKKLAPRSWSQVKEIRADLAGAGIDPTGVDRAMTHLSGLGFRGAGTTALSAALSTPAQRRAFLRLLVAELDRSRPQIPAEFLKVVVQQSRLTTAAGLSSTSAQKLVGLAGSTSTTTTTPAPQMAVRLTASSSTTTTTPAPAPATARTTSDLRTHFASSPSFQLGLKKIPITVAARATFQGDLLKGDLRAALLKRSGRAPVALLPRGVASGTPAIVVRDGSEARFRVSVPSESTPFRVKKNAQGRWCVEVKGALTELPTSLVARLDVMKSKPTLLVLLLERCLQRRPGALGDVVTLVPDPRRPSLSLTALVPVGGEVSIGAGAGMAALLVRTPSGTGFTESSTRISPERLQAALGRDALVAALLRDQLWIPPVVPSSAIPAPTALQQQAVDPTQEESAPDLYQRSLFARREYLLASAVDFPEIRGRKGVLSLADVLRHEDGDYLLPDGPTLVAGATVNLLGSTVALAGLISATTGSGLNAYLIGRHRADLKVEGWRLILDGQLVLVAGELWAGMKAVGTRDSLNMSGLLQLTHNGRSVFNTRLNASIAANGRAAVNIEHKLNLKLRIPRVPYRLAFDQTVNITGTLGVGHVSLRLDTTLTARLQVLSAKGWDDMGLNLSAGFVYAATERGTSLRVSGTMPREIKDALSAAVSGIEFVFGDIIDWDPSSGALTLEAGGL